MRAFLTGATGFVGNRLARRLRSDGHEVVALVREPDRARDLEALGVRPAAGDITARDTLVEPMRSVDAVFHVAAWYRVGEDASRADAVNVEGTRNVLETMLELGIPKGVYTSSLAINSNTAGRLVDEEYRYEGPHQSAYDRTKWLAHVEVALPLIERGLPLVVLMPGLVYGPGDTSQLGAAMWRAHEGRPALLPGGRSGVCWAHVDDVAEAHVLAYERGRPGRTYIVAGPCHTFREAFYTLHRVTGRPIRAIWVPPGAMRRLATVVEWVERSIRLPADYSSEALRSVGGTTYFGDNARARRELGYDPRSLAEGLRDTFARVGG